MINKFYKTIHNKYYKIFRFIFFLRYLLVIFIGSTALFLTIPNYFDYDKRINIINDHLSKNYNFNSKNELINSKGEPYIIVHQYDKRWNEFKNSVTNLKKKLGIN